MHVVYFLLLVVVSLTLQATVLDYVTIMGIKPELVMLLIALSGFLLGTREGAFLGFVGGMVEDLFLGSYIGLNAFSKMAAGYLAGLLGERLYRENSLIATGVTFIATLTGLMVNYLLLLHLDIHISLFYALLRVALPAAIYTALLAPVLFGRALRYAQMRSRGL